MSKKHKETVQKQFAKTVEAFSKTAARDTPEVLAEKVAFCKPKSTDVTLDVACGPGHLVLGLAPQVAFARGIDLTHAMLLQARAFQQEHHLANAAFDQGDAENLPYPDHSFDLVSCQCSFHHMPKPELALKEMLRVTKPEGRLMVIDPLAPESDAKFELYNKIESLRDPSHALTLRLTAFLAIFEELGLEITRQALRRRERPFNNWMFRAGLEPKHKRYVEARKLLEESIPGDRAGFSAKIQGDDIVIVHNEGMFLLQRAPQDGA